MRVKPRMAPRRKGSTMVEGAFVINVTLMLLLGIIEHSQVVLVRQVMSNAAREASRMAATGTGTKTTSDITTAINSYLGGVSISNLTVQIYKVDSTGANTGVWTDAGYGEGIRIRLDGNYVPFATTFSRIPNPMAITTQYIAFSESD